MLPGFIGIIIPLLPGIPYMFILALIYGIIDRFQHLSGKELIILGILAMVSLVVDYSSGLIGAKFGGASKRSVLYGLIGLIMGSIILPFIGSIAGLFIGVYVSEYLIHNDEQRAKKAATTSLIGSLGGIIVNIILGISFAVLFVMFTIK